MTGLKYCLAKEMLQVKKLKNQKSLALTSGQKVQFPVGTISIVRSLKSNLATLNSDWNPWYVLH